jgi:hypothetical protein
MIRRRSLGSKVYLMDVRLTAAAATVAAEWGYRPRIPISGTDLTPSALVR